MSLLALPAYYRFVSSAGMEPTPFAFNLPRQLLAQHRTVRVAAFYQGYGHKGVGIISFLKVKVIRHHQSRLHGCTANAVSRALCSEGSQICGFMLCDHLEMLNNCIFEFVFASEV